MATIKTQIHLSKLGNSKVAEIPSKIIKQLNLTDNQELTVTAKDGSIVLTPVKRKPTNIHDLFVDWEDDGKCEQKLDWGEAKGQELPW